MRVPIQAPPVTTVMPAKPVDEIVAQSCFGDCILSNMGLSQFSKCGSSNLMDIAQCLLAVGAITNVEAFVAKAAVYSTYCGGKCAY